MLHGYGKTENLVLKNCKIPNICIIYALHIVKTGTHGEEGGVGNYQEVHMMVSLSKYGMRARFLHYTSYMHPHWAPNVTGEKMLITFFPDKSYTLSRRYKSRLVLHGSTSVSYQPIPGDNRPHIPCFRYILVGGGGGGLW